MSSSHASHPGAELEPGLILIHGNQAEALRDVLLHWMRSYPLAPLESEVVLVHSNGIAQWLKLALAADPSAGGQGIAAGIDFYLPSRFLWQSYRTVLGAAAVPETSPFDESRLLWRLLRVLPRLVEDEVYAPLRRFLSDDQDQRKTFQLAERLADLYDQYQVYRPDWLAAWEAGADVLIDARNQSRPLPQGQLWQAALWRLVCAEIGSSEGSRAAVHTAFLARMETWGDAPPPAGLPRRVLLFGLSSLPRQSLEVLAALSRWVQILMCVNNPCEHYWADSVSERDLLRATRSRQQRKPGMPAVLDENALHAHAHPLLAAWGKQGRDTIAMLDEFDEPEQRAAYEARFGALGQRINLFVPQAGDGVLAQIQNDMLALRSMADIRSEQRVLQPGADASLRFHIAHSPLREVEILHDQLLAAFNADHSLRPRDVIVMVPDIDAYAPHIQAVFGLLSVQDPRYIPFSLADHGQRQADPLVHALTQLLALPQSRLSVSNVLDLLEVPAVQRRFGVDEQQLPVLRHWIEGANVRWGLHGEHRTSLALPDQAHAAPHTWLFGLRRMLLGYAVGETGQAWEGIQPYAEIGGLSAASLGPLLHFIERLEHTWRLLRQNADVPTWRQRLSQLLRDWFDVTPHEARRDAYTLERLEQALEAWELACQEAGMEDSLPLSVVSEFWLASLDAGGLSQRFFAGAVTFATLMPMRAIPFRHVCLLGMNDGDYPRQRQPIDFDLMARDYRPGDRSRREDDRYLFLEALLSARERCYISWVGRSIRDNSERPPSVLIGQLRDHVAQAWRLPGEEGLPVAQAGARVLAALTTEHPLQAFSPAYFRRAEPAPGALFTYAREWRATPAHAPVTEQRLPPLQRSTPLTVDELCQFLRDPAQSFLRQRLKVRLEDERAAAVEHEPFVLDGLDRHQLQAELADAQLRAFSEGRDPAAALHGTLAAMQARGDLPAGGPGELAAEALLEPMDALLQHYADEVRRWPVVDERSYPLRLEMVCDGQPLVLEDWIAGLRWRESDGEGDGSAAQAARVVVEPSALVSQSGEYRGKPLLSHWLAHVACQLAVGPVSSVILSKKGVVRYPPLGAAEARAYLSLVMETWYEGMHRPLPTTCASGFEWVTREDVRRVAQVLEGHQHAAGELSQSLYLARVWRTVEGFMASGEWQSLSQRLFGPMRAHLNRDSEA